MELEQYLKRVGAVAGNGADAAEVVDDFRNHVHEEIAATGIKIVTEEDVRRITSRLGLPESSVGEPVKRPLPEPPVQPPAGRSRKGIGMGVLLIFGVRSE